MKNDGGPAFPQNRVWNADRGEYEDSQQYPGMSLRDYFAAKAMQGVLANSNTKMTGASQEQMDKAFGEISRFSYQMANAMIAEREKPTQ